MQIVSFSDLQVSASGAAIWINSFLGVLTIIALWPVAIMFMHVREALRTLKMIPKYAMYQVCVCFVLIPHNFSTSLVFSIAGIK